MRWLLLLLLALPIRLFAADLSCRAEVDRRQTTPAEHVVLTLSAEFSGSQHPRHDPPVIPGVEVIAGGTSQSFNLVGSSATVAVSATYYLRSRSGQDFRIPPVTFQAGEERCTTEPIAIRVDAATAAPPAADPAASKRAAGPGQASSAPTGGAQAGRPGEAVFITLHTDRDTVWIGEQIVLTFRYHRLRNTWGQPSYTPPRTQGFWRVDMPPERNFRQVEAGQVYEVTEIRYALFPAHAGELTIEPAQLALSGDAFERLLGRRASGRRQLATEPLTIKVREWPAPQPPDFSGIAASQLEFTAGLDRQTVARGEPVTLSLRVAADALLKSFSGFNLAEAEGLRLFDAAESLSEDPTGSRYRAVFTQEKAVVPLREGDLSLPPLRLVYFDTRLGSYRTATAASPPLFATASDLPVAGDDPSGFRRAEIARLARDLAFIHPAPGPLRRQSPRLIQQAAWWIALAVPWCLLGGYRWQLRRRALAQRDPAGMRRRRAWPQTKRALLRLDRSGGDAADLARAVLGFAAAHLDRSPAGLTTADIQAWCETIAQAETGRRLTKILAACDRARFDKQASIDVASTAGEVLSLLGGLAERCQARPSSRRSRAGSPPAGVIVLSIALGWSLPPALVWGEEPVVLGPGRDPARLLAEGNQAYTEGDLDTAWRRYREALDTGADDAVLHYNLGNVLARRGELGRAIASYERAKRLAPRDRDVRTNLAWVRANTRDLELAGKKLPVVVSQLDAVVHRLSLDEWSLLLIVLSWATASSVAWTWRRGWLSAGWRRWRLLLGVVSLAAAVAVAWRGHAEIGRDLAVVVAAEVAVRSGPAETFPVVFQVHDGLVLEVHGEREGWSRIGLGGDWVGWLPFSSLERVRLR